MQPPPSLQTRVPGLPVSWATMKSLMLLLAANAASEQMVEHLVDGIRQQAPFLTTELIRRELAMVFAALVDPSFPGEGQTMT